MLDGRRAWAYVAAMMSAQGTPDPIAAARSDLLVEVASALIAELGIDGLTIRAVLARSGLARRAFYESFESKEDLVLAVFARTIAGATLLFAQQAAALTSPLARIELIVTGIVIGRGADDAEVLSQGDRRSAALSREHLRLGESRPEALQAALAPLLALIARFVAAGIAAGEVRSGDPDRLAGLIYNLVSTTMHQELRAAASCPPDPARRLDLARDIWDFCRRAIAA